MKTQLLPLAFVSLFVLGRLPADAATFSVSSTADAWDVNPGDGVCDDGTGRCPLRAAILEANALAGHDTLALNGVTHYLSPTYAGAGEDHSAFGDLDIRDDLTITTRYGAVATVDANGIGDRVFHVIQGATVDMTNLRIRNGTAGMEGGGGVRNDGVLTMTGVEVVGNSSLKNGGGVYNDANATLSFTDGTIHDNDAKQWGGGLYASYPSSAVFVDFSTIYGNEADSGGGVSNAGDGSTIVINDTAITANTARKDGGGGVFSQGASGCCGVALSAVQLTNVTVSGNTAPRRGGGIYNSNAQLGLVNTTVTDNWVPDSPSEIRGSGLANSVRDDGAGVWVVNSIIADNKGDEEDCTTPGDKIFSLGHNIEDDSSCKLSDPHDQHVPPSTVRLGPLQYNGGPTKTHELLSGSPAIDKGDAAWCPSIDQRKHPRPYGPACDIGAYEAGYKTTLTGKVFEVNGFSRRDGDGFNACMEFVPGGDFSLDGFGSGAWHEEIRDEQTLTFDGVAQDEHGLRLAVDGTADVAGQIGATAFDPRGVQYQIAGFENPDCMVATRASDENAAARLK
ncbi:MAG: choice-of-anchor Q domain-containing protein [Chromatiaceae bacterium]